MTGLSAAMTDQTAEREHREAMAAYRGWAARNRERITAEWDALPDMPLTMEDHIAAVRDAAGEEHWARMNAEWAK